MCVGWWLQGRLWRLVGQQQHGRASLGVSCSVESCRFGRVSWYHGNDIIKQRQNIINTFLANEGYRALGTHANFGIVVSQFTIGCTLSVGEVEQALSVADKASSGRGGRRRDNYIRSNKIKVGYVDLVRFMKRKGSR